MKVNFWSWLAKALDLNIIENAWGRMRRVCANRCQFEMTDEYQKFSGVCCDLKKKHMQRLYNSVAEILVDVLEKRGKKNYLLDGRLNTV